jgi:hypothetical protein
MWKNGINHGKMNIEHKYLIHLGFTHLFGDTIYWFEYSFNDDLYTNVYYHVDDDQYSLNGESVRCNFITLINELTFSFHGMSEESFKLFKRSETMKRILQ